MKIVVQGVGEVNLTQNHFVQQGGEGAVYARDNTAYKVYSDPRKMIPIGKIAELSAINDAGVIKPERVIEDGKGSPIGYTMRYAGSGCVVLCQSFTRAFRKRAGIEPDHVTRLVQRLRDEVASVHAAGALVVDLNEMNFLLDSTLTDVFAIDVDSYQTRSYPATALMESVRDRHSKRNHFDQGTDWFAFAITSFQMFAGIHPYKGKHPTLRTLDERMMANSSVFFDKGVAVPDVCYPIDVIPIAYRAWYERVLARGDRGEPPSDMRGGPIKIAMAQVVFSGGAHLDITEAARFEGDVVGIWEHGGHVVVVTNKHVYENGKQVGKNNFREVLGVGFSPKTGSAVIATRGGFFRANSDAVAFGSHVDETMSYGGRVYARSGDKVIEVVQMDTGAGGILCAPRVVANCMEKATRLWDGCAIQSMLGAMWVSTFPKNGVAPQVRVPELDGKVIVSAKCDGGVLMAVVASRSGRYDRIVLRFSDDGEKYDVREVNDVDPSSGLNFVTLDSGVCLHLVEDGKLEAFSAKMGKSGLKVVDDKALRGDITLCRWEGRAAFYQGDRVYKMMMK